jgi:hypothetical protein
MVRNIVLSAGTPLCRVRSKGHDDAVGDAPFMFFCITKTDLLVVLGDKWMEAGRPLPYRFTVDEFITTAPITLDRLRTEQTGGARAVADRGGNGWWGTPDGRYTEVMLVRPATAVQLVASTTKCHPPLRLRR